MKKLFTNDKFFLAAVIIAIAGSLLFCIYGLIYTPENYMGMSIIFISALCVLGLYISYKKHSKNVMKPLMGALLMSLVICQISFFSQTYSVFDLFFNIICLLMAIILFLNHLVINSSRQASPSSIRTNQSCALLFAVTYFVWVALWVPMAVNGLGRVLYAVFAVSVLCTLLTVVCVESRLDAYRLDREAAGWTEEAGYPEGYVHEYERNK